MSAVCPFNSLTLLNTQEKQVQYQDYNCASGNGITDSVLPNLQSNLDTMVDLRRLFGGPSAKSPPPLVEGDEVYPVHMLDDTKTLRDIVVVWTLRFNDVLDADKMHASLSRLLGIGDWRKLGGRLRVKVSC